LSDEIANALPPRNLGEIGTPTASTVTAARTQTCAAVTTVASEIGCYSSDGGSHAPTQAASNAIQEAEKAETEAVAAVKIVQAEGAGGILTPHSSAVPASNAIKEAEKAETEAVAAVKIAQAGGAGSSDMQVLSKDDLDAISQVVSAKSGSPLTPAERQRAATMVSLKLKCPDGYTSTGSPNDLKERWKRTSGRLGDSGIIVLVYLFSCKCQTCNCKSDGVFAPYQAFFKAGAIGSGNSSSLAKLEAAGYTKQEYMMSNNSFLAVRKPESVSVADSMKHCNEPQATGGSNLGGQNKNPYTCCT